jgi:PAS domain S-box-containing protein
VSSLSTSGVRRRRSSARPEGERLAELAASLLATTDGDGRLLYVNRAWERLLGWDPREVIGKKAIHMAHPDERKAVAAALRKTEDGQEAAAECRVMARDGRWLWIDWRVRAEGGRWYLAGRDVSERRQLEEERAAGEARLAQAQRVSGVGSFEFDVETRQLVWSDEHFRVLSLDPGGVEAGTDLLFELTHPDDRGRVQAYWEQLLIDPRRAPDTLEFRVQRADGAERIVQLRTSVAEGQEGRKLIGTIQDVSERRRTQMALEASERRYRALVEQVPAIVYTAGLGPDGAWDFVSPHVERLLGHPAKEWTENSALWYASIHPDDREQALEDEEQLRGPGAQLRSEYRMIAKDGRVVHVLDEGTVIENEHGELRLQGVVLDVTDHREAAQALRETHDRMQQIVDNSPLLVFAKGRDHRFLLANRELGELFGVEPAELIGSDGSGHLPPALLDELIEQDARVMDTGDPIEVEVTIPRVVGGDRAYVVHKFPLRDGDGAIYGMGAVATDITERKAREEALRARVEWSARIRHAIEADRFVLHAQPIVDVATGESVQQELLVRMVGDDGELIMPSKFLPAAERFDLAPAIDRWVVRRAARLARDRRVEVNLSAQSIGNSQLTEHIEAELRLSGAEPANLVFEITETTAAKDLGKARELADRLTGLGCGFALDDFGTGYGSFTYLKHLPVSYLKIDMEFVRDLAADPADKQVVKAIVDVASNFGIKTIAEGVESEETLEVLRGLGVDYAQGFHLGRPELVAG